MRLININILCISILSRTLVESKESITKFFDFMVGMGLFQCLWSLLHILDIGLVGDYARVNTVLRKMYSLQVELLEAPSLLP